MSKVEGTSGQGQKDGQLERKTQGEIKEETSDLLEEKDLKNYEAMDEPYTTPAGERMIGELKNQMRDQIEKNERLLKEVLKEKDKHRQDLIDIIEKQMNEKGALERIGHAIANLIYKWAGGSED